MKKRKRSIFILALCIILLFNVSGCWNRRELNTLAIVMGLGIDKAQEPNRIQLTAQVAKPNELKSTSSGGSNSGGQAFWNIQNSGDTLFSTLRDFTHESNRKLYFPHIQVLVFGRDFAEDGVKEELDFFTRDHETRLNIRLVISEDKASEVLNIESELDKIPAMNISKLIEAQEANSQTNTNLLNDFIADLISKKTAPTAPLVEIVGKGDKKSLQVKGTAVFNKDKLIGELDKYETRGLLWVTDEVKSGIIDVECPGGSGKVSLEILKSKTKVYAEIVDDKVHMKVDIREKSALGGQYCSDDLGTKKSFEILERLQAIAIQDEVLAAVKKAQELNADIFGFGEVVHKQHRHEWENMKDQWDKIFPSIVVEVWVDASIERSGRAYNSPATDKE